VARGKRHTASKRTPTSGNVDGGFRILKGLTHAEKSLVAPVWIRALVCPFAAVIALLKAFVPWQVLAW
jgi:hypothetical protein